MPGFLYLMRVVITISISLKKLNNIFKVTLIQSKYKLKNKR